ncbi:TlyA family rRNA (cytidine-2'-O)-methyltransferase [Mesoplasma syrphidae]|uniref:TlyA family rRNA (Cytidine-2'-O)-methyltransferase n=1 Tax=Mesoplasma syrphidae TaxID=225999 RepID=A0A2K9BJZ7_9MOLU|nr:TlyA family RNA methyltransferase [Mesoplasma syrphidae]AUF83586.1 TlyA family rRNA (cytidine-2'-O)-methyltransferase [Mesoplasma syrphidae]
MKMRLDHYLVDNGLAENRSKAKLYISGQKKVYVNNKLINKAGFSVSQEDIIKVVDIEKEFVSRAGLKLYKAIKVWNINLDNKICLDIGASTGGFTQCCLENNARKVFAVDVGIDQLHSTLKNDHRVISMEKYNFRNAKKNDFGNNIDFFSCDVSFISVIKILEALTDILEENAQGVILIKPQFESEVFEIKNGKANSKELHVKAILKIVTFANGLGFDLTDLDFSPITGNKKQNIEYLAFLTKKSGSAKIWAIDEIEAIVNCAWKALS